MNKELTGTNIELTNASERQLSSFQMEGKSEQEIREDVNIIDVLAYRAPGSYGPINGITYTVLEDGKIKVNGTANDTSVFYIEPDGNLPLLDGIKTISGGSTNIAFQLAINDNGTIVYPTVYGTSSSRNYTSAIIRAILLVVSAGKTINDEIIYLQFQEGNVATSYQQRNAGRYGNICPPTIDSRWKFEGGTYVDNEGNIVLPNLTSKAYIWLPWNKRSDRMHLVYTLVSGGNVLVNTAYLDENKGQLSGNGSAVMDKPDGYKHISAFGGENIYGDALALSKYVVITFQRNAEYAPNPYKINNISVSIDDDVFTEYRPVTPTMEDPSKIKSVGYENLFDINATHTDGSATSAISGDVLKIVTNGAYARTDYTNIQLPNNTYTISFDWESDTSLSGTDARIYIYNGATVGTLLTYSNLVGASGKASLTFTNTTGAISIRFSPNNTETAKTITMIFSKIQIEKGTQVHSYIPNGKYGIEVETVGENLFDVEKWVKSGNNSQYYSYENGELSINALDTRTLESFTEQDKIYLPNGNYYLSNISSATIRIYNNNTNTTVNTNKFEVTLGYIYLKLVSSNVIKIKPMVNKGDIELPYKPHYKNNTVIILDEPLRSLPNDPCDLLLIENNKLYVDRYIGEIILNGSETWFSYTTGGANGYVYYTIIDDSIVGLNKSLCSHFKNVSFAWDVGDIGDFSDHPTLKYKYFVTDKPTITEFKTWLEQNPIHVVYERETPVDQKLGDVDMPTTTYGTNYITTNTDIQPRLAIEYFKGFSDEDKQAIKNGTVAIKSRIIVNTEPQMVLTENDSIKDWEYCDERYVPQQGFIGQFVARTLSGNLQDISDDFNIENHEIELQLGVVEMSSGEETWYSFGDFLVTSPEGDEVTDNTKFEAMDYTKKFNVDFDGNYTSENFPESYNAIVAIDETTGEPKGSVTALWLARYTCEQACVPFGQNTFTNADYIIDFNPYQAGESCRDVMKDIAKLAFSWVRVDVDNKCYIDFKESSEDYGDEYNVFTNDEYYSLETKKEIYGPINRVYIGMSNIDGESIIVAEDKEDIEANGEKALYIYDNQLTYSPELRALIADNHSADKLLGLTYTHLTTETIGHPWLNGKEFISVIGMEDNECKTYPFNRIIKFNGHIKSTLDSMGESEVEATLGYESDVVKNAKNAMVLVKKHEGEIELLATNVTDVQDNIKDNYYTKQETNNTISNATSGLTNIYTSAGGNNRFRNTGLHFKEADGFEYWNGLVEVIAEINSATQTAMLLQNGSVSQMISNLPNGKYTISFKYEELIESSSAYVLINSTRYDLAGSGTFKQTIDVNTNNIEIDFNCDTNGGFKIYELMGNVGETALVWTQHPDEIMTDTVNISKGITITSSRTDAIFKAGADGIRIENRSKNTTTEFLENGMSTNDAEIKGQAKISGSLFTKVGNQTWISGL